MTIQKRNSEMADLLRPDLLHRRETVFALMATPSTYLMLPRLRGFWPISSVNTANEYSDISGQGRHLSAVGAAFPYDTGAISAIELQYGYAKRDNEAGLRMDNYVTFGCWVQVNAYPDESDEYAGIMGMWSATQASYILRMRDDQHVLLATSDGGGAADVEIDGGVIDLGRWAFLVGRYDGPTDTVDLWIDETKISHTDTPLFSLYESFEPLSFGAYADGNYRLNGRVALPFICAWPVSDIMISAIYQASKPFFYPA